ncbi:MULTISPECIES: hypothetical protein [unclassified Chelatococcus]|uniref:hypothetical protein n=1 Tax=unclassified Chelatococcus TaxID=2638111 RepID=UPI0002E1A75F|nr:MULTISPECIES: hypothetical protein [unclassified Chelatococcus]ALA19050.1 hypothetical protein AL346_18590 [Chelatococcus sp. CO-6]
MIAAALLEEMHEAHLVRAAEAAGRAFGRCCESDGHWMLAPDPVPVIWRTITPDESQAKPARGVVLGQRPSSKAA